MYIELHIVMLHYKTTRTICIRIIFFLNSINIIDLLLLVIFQLISIVLKTFRELLLRIKLRMLLSLYKNALCTDMLGFKVFHCIIVYKKFFFKFNRMLHIYFSGKIVLFFVFDMFRTKL